jgi:hypothetical protein
MVYFLGFAADVSRLPIRLCVARQMCSLVGFPVIRRTSPQHNSLVRDSLVAVWVFLELAHRRPCSIALLLHSWHGLRVD